MAGSAGKAGLNQDRAGVSHMDSIGRMPAPAQPAITPLRRKKRLKLDC
jgi:hypothetical protein